MKVELQLNSESSNFLRKNKRTGSKKKKGNRRSQMLKMVMPLLSSADGQELQDAIANGDSQKVEAIMLRIGKQLRTQMERNKK